MPVLLNGDLFNDLELPLAIALGANYWLVAIYGDDCLAVHPSFFAVAKRASLDDDRTHRFSSFDLDEDDSQHTYFVIRFFTLLQCHVQMMVFLTTVFYPSGHFDSKRWMSALTPFVGR